MDKPKITEQDYQKAAEELNCETAVIKAVAEIESKGSGFNKDDSLVILFEGHVFWRRLKAHGKEPMIIQSDDNKDILYRTWERHYLGGIKEWTRLERAILIHPEAALESASWGKFQIMGENYKSLGFESVTDFVDFLDQGEGNHLHAFVKFCKVNNLERHLRKKNWSAFAKQYNGPQYALNKYDKRLAAAYKKYAG